MDESHFLFGIFGTGKARGMWLYTTNLDPSHPLKLEDGYSQPVIWRLDAPINTLKLGFEKFIKEQRELNKINPRKSPSETSKRPPWNYIEILDTVDLLDKKPRGGIDPERTLRTARADAKQYLQTLLAELNMKAGNNPRSRSYLWPELKR